MDKKLTLPDFLKFLTSNNVPVPKAMAVASKVSVSPLTHPSPFLNPPRFKEYNTPALLAQLDDAKLQVLGVKDKDLHRLVLAAVRKAGYTRSSRKPGSGGGSFAQPVAGPSGSKPSDIVQALVRPSF